MATFRWFNGNQGNFGYQDFGDYDITRITSNAIIAEYNGSDGPQDDARQPARIKVVIKDAVALNPGSSLSDRRFSEGTITKIIWFNSSGDKVLEASGLNVSLPVVSAMTATDRAYLLDDLIWSGGHRFVGSDDSMGPDWDGDDIRTGSGDDTVKGNDGGDFISDQGGTDTYNGGAGRDTLNYSDSFYNIFLAKQGIQADLKAGTIVGTDGLTDQVSNIENVRGSFMDDVMKGNGADNRFTGLQGNDFFHGRGGFDTIRYDRDDRQGGFEGVMVNLGKGTAIDGFGNRDTFKSIEGVRGSNYDDVLKDSGIDNWLSGRDGDDVICVNNGNDTLEGGSGADVFQFKSKSFGDNTIRDFEDGVDMIEILHAKRFSQLTIEDTGDGAALVSYRGSSITVDNVSASDLTADDFIF
ncbi:hypothetical protein AB9K35_14140 [Leisingera sp. XS_AS12]|uniref:hypothetical protein n=1 Tax=Leisingera sp. XS_AS12 TaxID=3241294 RepID=UPI003516C7F5